MRPSIALALLLFACGGGTATTPDGSIPSPDARMPDAAAPPDAGPWPVVGTLALTYPGRFQANAIGDFKGDGSTVVLFHGPRVSTDPTRTPFKAISVAVDGTIADITATLIAGTPSATEGRRALAADFNGDGRLDFFCANQGLDSAPYPGERQTLLVSTPGGKLTDISDQLPPLVNFAHSAAAADLRKQGKLDILVGVNDLQMNPGLPDEYKGPNTTDDDKVGPWMLRNDGSGNLTYDNVSLPAKVALPFLATGSPGRFTTSLFADVDRDTYPDLVLGGFLTGAGGAVYLNDHTGSFDESAEVLLPVGRFGADHTISNDSLATDLDGDGWLDLLLLQAPNDYAGNRIQVLMNDQHGGFTDATDARFPGQTSGPYWGVFMFHVDFDGDGDKDLFVMEDFSYPTEPGPTTTDHLLFLNDGTGRFAPAPDAMVPPRAEWHSLIPVDFTRDGKPDLLGFDYDFSHMTIRAYANNR